MRTSLFLHFAPARLCVPLAVLALVLPLRGDDGAASVGAGGVVLRREARISMEKERLTIGMRKVTVEFDFLNESAQDISTEVAFPIPPYNESLMLGMERLPNFPDFKVWVDGREIEYKTEIKGSLGGKDYSALLQKMGINIETFGDFPVYDGATRGADQISKLTAAEQSQLVAAGLLKRSVGEKYLPLWTVSKTYYWKQDFPAHRIVRIRHEYTPVAGAAEIPIEYFDTRTRAENAKSGSAGYADAKAVDEMTAEACIGDSLRKKLSSGSKSGLVFVDYVNYILTSANSWKTPIKDFELIVEATNSGSNDPVRAAFCWDGPIKKGDANHFYAKANNFVPKKELAVYFFRQ
jgi:Domain of unknown function (DUF4424)